MTMARFKSEVWNHFEINGKRSICKFCGKEAFKNPSRMPLHLTKCLKCPESIREKMRGELPKSLCKFVRKRDTAPTHYIVKSDEYEIADVEVVNEEEVETNTTFDSNRYSYDLKNDESSFTTKFYEEKADEYTLFGNSVAHKLRNINNPRARTIAQYYINTVLFRAEMTNFKQDVSLSAAQEFTLFDTINQENANENNQTQFTNSTS